MKTVFISKLKPFLDAVAKDIELYVPVKDKEHYVFGIYDPSEQTTVELNNIRACTPVKEFLFPMRELAATYPTPSKPEDIKPFAVFGLKDCDLRSIDVLDKVFQEEDLKDELYVARREKMFIISSDCFKPAESCFCNVMDGQGFCQSGFDLNVSKIKDGFIIEAGSQKGEEFIEKHPRLFTEAADVLLTERDKSRTEAQQQLEQNNAEMKFDEEIRDFMEECQDSEVFDVEAQSCVECQACTRVCPTCHCFYLFDAKQKDYFAKMKMWDGCMRFGYAAVAGGENPNKVLGDRLRHRLMHKFVHFVDRYGINMCVGCGRCVDAEAGGVDIRQVLKKLYEEFKDKKEVKVTK